MTVRRAEWVCVVLGTVLSGCSSPPPPPPDTGSREAVRNFFDALRHQEWRRAYDALHPDSQKRYTPEEFTRLARAYRQNLGFTPEDLHVRSCEERGKDGIARVVWTGHMASRSRRYNDGIALRQAPVGWRVVLPSHFGKKSP